MGQKFSLGNLTERPDKNPESAASGWLMYSQVTTEAINLDLKGQAANTDLFSPSVSSQRTIRAWAELVSCEAIWVYPYLSWLNSTRLQDELSAEVPFPLDQQLKRKSVEFAKGTGSQVDCTWKNIGNG